jgi:hypothetical protein
MAKKKPPKPPRRPTKPDDEDEDEDQGDDEDEQATDTLTSSLLAGLKQEWENPDADDERFNRQAAAITDADYLDLSPGEEAAAPYVDSPEDQLQQPVEGHEPPGAGKDHERQRVPEQRPEREESES